MTRKRQSRFKRLLRRVGACALAGSLALVFACLAAWLHLRVTENRRAGRYDSIILDAARRHHASPSLAKAVIWRESRFRPLSVGRHGEVGLMQITDIAVREYHRVTEKPLPAYAVRFSPRMNIEIGCWILGRATARWRDYASCDMLVLAEYNAGLSRARDWAPKHPEQSLPYEVISIGSTRDYIKSVLAKRRQFQREYAAREQR